MSWDKKPIYLLFFLALLIHSLAVLFIHYTNFQPFGDHGGDFIEYHQIAQEVASRVHQGDFSVAGLRTSHYYPIIVGYLYALTLPDELIGQLFNVWLASLIVLLAYLIVIEIGGSPKGAFLVGLLTAIYPSLLFYGSLLLKDALVVVLTLWRLLFLLKLLKDFSWGSFLFFYLLLAALTHFRFYLSYALIVRGLSRTA